MYQPIGYYATHDESYEPLCPTCAREEAHEKNLDLDNSENFVPTWEWDEFDSLEYCANCYELIDVSLSAYGLDQLRTQMLDAVSRGNFDSARSYAETLREHFEPAGVYVYVSCSEGHEPAETSEPYATFHECAEAMLYAYADFPNIDSIDVEYDGDTIVSAAIDFLGGWFVQVQELDL